MATEKLEKIIMWNDFWFIAGGFIFLGIFIGGIVGIATSSVWLGLLFLLPIWLMGIAQFLKSELPRHTEDFQRRRAEFYANH